MTELYYALFFIGGIILGAVGWAVVIARDEEVVKLQPDEVIIKRPHPELILVQVAPDVARRLINSGGDMIISPNKTEARALYPERTFRAKIEQGNKIDQ